MSHDNRYWKSQGFYVQHRYERRSGRNPVCVRCGVRRRWVSGGWEYRRGRRWSPNNPPCIHRSVSK